MFLFSKLYDYKSAGDIDEVSLWKSFCRGDEEAFNKLFRLYYTPLYDYGMKLFADNESAKDGIQKLFLKLWKKRHSLTIPDSVQAYLLVSYRRILLRDQDQKKNRYRRNKKYIQTKFEGSFTKEELIIQDERIAHQKEELTDGLNQLSNRQKETLFLKYYHGLTNKEIAQVIDINHQSVKNNLYRAIKSLKKVVKLTPQAE